MQIVTTFFNNEQYYMMNFIRWYKTIWKADKFVFFIGRNRLEDTNYERSGLKCKVTRMDGMTIYEYASGTNTTAMWNNLKLVFYDIIRYEHDNFPSMWVDCDEFVYSKNIVQAVKEVDFKTHFYEYVPVKPFNMNDSSLWSECPWHYRVQALAGRPIIPADLIYHADCKFFTFDPARQSGHIGGVNHYCNDNKSYNDYDNICFHIGVCSKEHYLTRKHWMQTHPNGIEINDIDRKSGMLSGIFDKYYAICGFKTFELNLFEKYMFEKSLKGVKI